jgi:YbgC/YbaW family acyl-CoA thioester hydrolase
MPPRYFTREELLAAPAGAYRWECAVRLQDVDAAGIVFFARIFEYFHDGLMAYLEQHGVSMPDWLADGVVLAPIKHAEADYIAPLRFGDRLAVELCRGWVADTETMVGYRLVFAASGRPAAVGQTHHVCVDRASGARAALPPPFAAAFRRLPAADGLNAGGRG